MASEAVERVCEALLDARFQREVAQVLVVARDQGARLRALRPFFGHSIVRGLQERGLLGTLLKDEVVLIHEALRSFIEDLFLEIPVSGMSSVVTQLENAGSLDPVVNTPIYEIKGEDASRFIPLDSIYRETKPRDDLYPEAPKDFQTLNDALFENRPVVESTRRRLQLPLFVQILRAHFKERAMEQTIDTLEVDSNSGLLTKAAAEKKIEQLIDENPNRKVAVFFVDGDGLKSVNNISRDAGNACMKAQAERLKAGTRPSDMVVRWGTGDEMAHIALDVSSEGDLIAIGERHLAKMRAEKVLVQDSNGADILLDRTISIGCAMGEMKDIFDLIRLADDKALKRAKGGTFEEECDWSTLQEAPPAHAGKPGRNRLCVYPSGSIHGECGPMNKLNFLQEEIGEGTDE